MTVGNIAPVARSQTPQVNTNTNAPNAQTLGYSLPMMSGFDAGYGANLPGSLQALDRMPPQVNAANQSAIAGNGDVNQVVENNNTYENNYYNIYGVQGSPGAAYPGYSFNNSGTIHPGFGGFQGGWTGAYPFSGWDSGGGITGFFRRLFARF